MPNPFMSYLATAGQALKSGFNDACHGEFAAAFSNIGAVGQNILNFLGFGWNVYELAKLAKRSDLKPRQKIIPMIGYALAALTALATGIVVCLAATVLLPPFIFVGSVVNVVRNIGVYFQERSEKRNLRKFFNDSNALDKEINQVDLSDKLLGNKLANDFKDFIKQPHFDANKLQELYVRIGNHFLNQTSSEQQALSELIQKLKNPKLLEKEKKSLSAKIKEQEKGLKKRFQEKYGDLFKLIEKKQRLHFLQKSGRSRLLNMGLSVGIAALSLVAWVVPLTISATPAALLAPFVYGALTGASMALVGAVGINATKIAIQETRSAKKAKGPKDKISKVVYPRMPKAPKAVNDQKNAESTKPLQQMDMVIAELVAKGFNRQKNRPSEMPKTQAQVAAETKRNTVCLFTIPKDEEGAKETKKLKEVVTSPKLPKPRK